MVTNYLYPAGYMRYADISATPVIPEVFEPKLRGCIPFTRIDVLRRPPQGVMINSAGEAYLGVSTRTSSEVSMVE